MFAFTIHSPVDEIKLPFLEEAGVQLFLKRDDMIHPYISGNKWRKLKYHLIKAKESGKSHLVTFGGIWSNHLIAAACACASFGFKSSAFVRGEDLNNEALFLCRMFGMHLIFTDRKSYRNKEQLFEARFGKDPSAFYVGEGGSGKEGARGCAELIDELKESFDHIFVAAGTGTTAAGIINGICKNYPGIQAHVIPVLKGDFLVREIDELLEVPFPYIFHEDYHFGGYAKTQPELLHFIRDFSTSTGILTDPVYTGKTLFAVTDLIKKGLFPKGSRILAIHTGGLFGLLGMKEKFVVDEDQDLSAK